MRYAAGEPCMIKGRGPHAGKVIVLRSRLVHSNGLAWLYEGQLLGSGSGQEDRPVLAFFEHMLIPLVDEPGVDEVNLVRMMRRGYPIAGQVLANRKAAREQSRPTA